MVKFQLNLNSQTALAAAVGEHYRPGIVAAVTMVDNSSVEHRLLVSQPVSSPISMMGQGTRYYWAVDADSRQVVFLKDTWRWNGKRQMEGEILADLHAAGVPNIPQLMYHGDVREPRTQTNEITQPDNDDFEACWALQYTQTDLFCQAHWVSKTVSPFRPLVHYRLVFGTVGYGLEQFRGARELLHGTYDVYQAMLGAFGIEDPAKRRLHCDISLSSIIRPGIPTQQA
ncbi:hypothetical protein SCP_0607360 [Sparassis crispa]|uniref:Fungal-type protein kinase domain-containing protein n=1 Tax=Sparassis crispa TaxID=139825 RepID=A0A401GRA9_9APHY|nr:hypothetical protein SCP_0607360 [Sparassis crispa]GBE84756.1 hypothetical protein SCP_0607360 [Sparassis crispa]